MLSFKWESNRLNNSSASYSPRFHETYLSTGVAHALRFLRATNFISVTIICTPDIPTAKLSETSQISNMTTKHASSLSASATHNTDKYDNRVGSRLRMVVHPT